MPLTLISIVGAIGKKQGKGSYPPCRVGPTSVVRVGGGAALSYSRGRDHVHVGDKMARSLVSVDKASLTRRRLRQQQNNTRASRQATQE
jgi:hypothetical protein